LTCAANLNAIIRRLRNNPLLVPDLRTHWRQFQIAARFANFPGSARRPAASGRPLVDRFRSVANLVSMVRYYVAQQSLKGFGRRPKPARGPRALP
jgi:hypothetical protein